MIPRHSLEFNDDTVGSQMGWAVAIGYLRALQHATEPSSGFTSEGTSPELCLSHSARSQQVSVKGGSDGSNASRRSWGGVDLLRGHTRQLVPMDIATALVGDYFCGPFNNIQIRSREYLPFVGFEFQILSNTGFTAADVVRFMTLSSIRVVHGDQTPHTCVSGSVLVRCHTLHDDTGLFFSTQPVRKEEQGDHDSRRRSGWASSDGGSDRSRAWLAPINGARGRLPSIAGAP